MKRKTLILSFWTLLISVNFCYSQTKEIEDEIVILANLSKFAKLDSTIKQKEEQSNIELEDMFKFHFRKAKYISSANENYLDSIFLASPKAIKLEKRWYKKIPRRCCFGDCHIWTINIKVSIKNKIISEFFFDSGEFDFLPKKIA